jgi:hypothetical protein
METAVTQTQFYKDADEGLALFTGEQLPETMQTVVGFCVGHGIVTAEPKVGYGTAEEAPEAQLRFDPSYIQEVKGRAE